MNLKQIEDETLQLRDEERAELAQKLLICLDSPLVNMKLLQIDYVK